jgi:hypothetical protein
MGLLAESFIKTSITFAAQAANKPELAQVDKSNTPPIHNCQ